jgi:hypothetical protein
MKQELASQYRQAVEEFCDLIIGSKVLNSTEDEEVRTRIEAAERRCEAMRSALFDADAA